MHSATRTPNCPRMAQAMLHLQKQQNQCNSDGSSRAVQKQRAPIQDEMGEMEATGALVASQRKASFSRLIIILSMMGRKVLHSKKLASNRSTHYCSSADMCSKRCDG